MQFIPETFLQLSPVDKIKRTPIDGYSGLYLEQNSTGFTFQLKYYSPQTGKRRFYKLARFKYGDLINKKILDNVLNQYFIARGDVTQRIDPLEQKKAIREANKPKKLKTVNQLFDEFTESRFFKQLAPNSQKGYLFTYKNHVAKQFGRRDIATITRSDLKSHIDQIPEDTVYNNVLKIFKKIQRLAVDQELINSPFLFEVDLRPAGTRTETLNDSEIISLLTSTHGLDSIRNIAKLQLLTGCRISEVTGAQWIEFDISAKTWTIPPERIKTERAYKKMCRPHVIPLMPKMSGILLQQRQYGTNGLVFKKAYNVDTDKPYHASQVQYWLKEINSIASSHWLRRTIASRLAEMPGVSEYDAKIILNHAVSGNTGKYIHTQQLERKREIYFKWHNYLDSLLDIGDYKNG